MASNFIISGTPIKNPSTFKIETYNLTDLARRADGKMVGDFISQKRKFFFTYDVVNSRDLQLLKDLTINNQNIFFPLEYIENNVKKSAQVYVGAFPQNLVRDGSLWYWEGINFDLIEQ